MRRTLRFILPAAVAALAACADASAPLAPERAAVARAPGGGGGGDATIESLTVSTIWHQDPAPANETCGHYVSVSGGSGSYSYNWYVNGSWQPDDGWGGMLYTNGGSDYFVEVYVTDGANSGYSGKWVDVVANPRGFACLQ
jgi:hypothetical protein